MSVVLTELLNDVAGRVNSVPSNSDFQRAFLSAVRSALMEIRNLGYVSPTFPNSSDATIENIDERYLPALYDGVIYFLHKRSEWSTKDSSTSLKADWEISKRRTIHIYFNDTAPEGRHGDYSD